MSTGNYLIDIEDATIAKILTGKRPHPDEARAMVNKCDVFRGDKDDAFFAIVREVAPAVWLRLDREINKPEEFKQALAGGLAVTTATASNNVDLVWSFFLCAASLRATKELSHGGPGVIGAYELIQMLIGPPKGMPNPPAASDGQLKGWKPVTYAEPFIFVGLELLGQTTTAAVYDLQLRTRVQL